jgi:hypothetical protein
LYQTIIKSNCHLGSFARADMKNSQLTHKQPLSLPFARTNPQPQTSTIVPLQHQEERILTEWEQFTVQAERINQIAGELETAIFELKAMASRINSLRRYRLPPGKQCQDICEYSTVSIPCIGRKEDGLFMLATQRIDLFRAEKEAERLAQRLRQQTKKPSTQEYRKKLAVS